ncbi:MAG: hypothetical protein CMJ78_18690 [Planctomycetaceae bacterium]|nr:hypothetical protein [Planctomycetaceae bacterium]
MTRSRNRDMILPTLDKLACGESVGTPQPSINPPILPRRRPADGIIEWSQSNREIYDHVRAITHPYPGAFSFLGTEKWTIWSIACLPVSTETRHGQVMGPMISPEPYACGQSFLAVTARSRSWKLKTKAAEFSVEPSWWN